MKLSVLYGKKVKSTAGKRGYVISVNADGLKIVSLTCADDEEKKFCIAADKIKSVKDVIIYEESENEYVMGETLRLGKPVFDCDATYLGLLTDFTIEKNEIAYAHVGKKKFSANDIVCGDAVIIKNSARILKRDVKKNGKIIIKRGTPLTPEILDRAQKHGEYVQTNLKTF